MNLSFLSALSRRQLTVLIASAAAVVVTVAVAMAIVITAPKKDPSALPSASGSAAASSGKNGSSSSAAVPVVTDPAEVGTVLPETADAGRSYVDETLFIGDSNTARYLLYADDTGKAFTTSDNNIGVVSMGAGAITTLECEQFTGSSKMYTVPKAVAMLKPQRIIICYGTNNLSGTSTDATSFISTYLKGLNAIREAWPYCDIIVSAIPPLDKQRSNTRLEMVQVDAYNAAIEKMCEDNDFKFLNTAEVLKDSATGWAKKDYTLSDGVHLSKTAVTALFQYVRTHAYITEDRRPQPLGSIPKPVGVPVNLIKEDPIAVRDAKVPLEFVVQGSGVLAGETSQLVRKGGVAEAVTAKPDKGWVFSGWQASDGNVYTDATFAFTMPDTANAGGEVLTAVFIKCEHKYPDTEEYRDKSPLSLSTEYNTYPENCLAEHTYTYDCSICGDTVQITKKLYDDHEWNDAAGEDGAIHCKHTGCTQVKEVATPTPSAEPTTTPESTATPPESTTTPPESTTTPPESTTTPPESTTTPPESTTTPPESTTTPPESTTTPPETTTTPPETTTTPPETTTTPPETTTTPPETTTTPETTTQPENTEQSENTEQLAPATEPPAAEPPVAEPPAAEAPAE